MSDARFKPVSGFVLPRYAGVPTFMRLPLVTAQDPDYQKIDVAFVGVPWDGGTTNRPGARHGPRQLRDASTMIRAEHPATHQRPFETLNCADIGDVAPNPADLMDSLNRIATFYKGLKSDGIIPISAGGDHLISLPILRGLASDGPVGMVHFDAHTDLFKEYFDGRQYTHGTPFRRAIEEGLLDPKRVIQIGIRGTMYDDEDLVFGRERGVTIITTDELMERGLETVMKEAREVVGNEKTYVSFDIDFLDPSICPGTGTPEIGGPNSWQAQQMVRKLQGLNIIGADLVEVSPPFDQSGGTAWVGASILFEMLCAIAPGSQ